MNTEAEELASHLVSQMNLSMILVVMNSIIFTHADNLERKGWACSNPGSNLEQEDPKTTRSKEKDKQTNKQKIDMRCIHVWALLISLKNQHTCISSPQPFPILPPTLYIVFFI